MSEQELREFKDSIITAIKDCVAPKEFPEFPPGDIPVPVAANVYKKDPTWVRAGIIAGWLPIGIATRDGKLITGDVNEIDSRKGKISYFISPKKLWEDTGFIWKGERNPDELG